MFIATKQWSDRVIYAELADLDPQFRDVSPKKEFKGVS